MPGPTQMSLVFNVVLRKADGTSIVDTAFAGFNFNANIIVYNNTRYLVSSVDYNSGDGKYYITVMPAEQ
jgi:hypothetical protein